jgi:hypothetical protein
MDDSNIYSKSINKSIIFRAFHAKVGQARAEMATARGTLVDVVLGGVGGHHQHQGQQQAVDEHPRHSP